MFENDPNLSEISTGQAVFVLIVAAFVIWRAWRWTLPYSKKLPKGVPERHFWGRLCEAEDSEITAAATRLGLRSGNGFPRIHGTISTMQGNKKIGLAIEPAVGTYTAWLNPLVETELSQALGVPVVIYPTRYPPYWKHWERGARKFPPHRGRNSPKATVTVRWGQIPKMPSDATRVDTYPEAR